MDALASVRAIPQRHKGTAGSPTNFSADGRGRGTATTATELLLQATIIPPPSSQVELRKSCLLRRSITGHELWHSVRIHLNQDPCWMKHLARQFQSQCSSNGKISPATGEQNTAHDKIMVEVPGRQYRQLAREYQQHIVFLARHASDLARAVHAAQLVMNESITDVIKPTPSTTCALPIVPAKGAPSSPRMKPRELRRALPL